MSEQDLGDTDYPYIRVESCEQALKDIAEHYRRSLDIKVVGISGSVGKTSTKEMIASVLSQKYNVLKTEGNFNNEIGLRSPSSISVKSTRWPVLEMGISNFGEMTRLAKVARPDICVITNIGVAIWRTWDPRRHPEGKNRNVRLYEPGGDHHPQRR